MSRLRTLRARFTAGMAVVAVILVVITVTSLVAAIQAADANQRLQDALRLDAAINHLTSAINEQEAGVFSASLVDPSLSSAFDDGTAQMQAALIDLRPYELSPRYSTILLVVLDSLEQWRSWALRARAASAAQGPAVPSGQGARLLENYRDANSRVEQVVSAETRRDAAVATQYEQALFAVTAGAGVLIVAILAALAWLFFISTLAPVRKLAADAAALAENRPVTVGQPRRADEVGELQRAMRAWQASIAERQRISATLAELSTTAGVTRLAQLASSRISEILGARVVSVTVIRPAGPVVVHRETVDVDSELLWAARGDGNGHSPGLEALKAGRILAGDLGDPGWGPETVELAGTLGLGPSLSLPMRSGGRLVGVITAIRGSVDEAFTAEDADRVEPIVVSLAAEVDSALGVELLEAANLRLAAADRQKTEFISSVNHELRTPLNSILGFTDLLLVEPAASTLTPKQQRWIANIGKSGRHLLTLVNDLLDLAKVEAGRIDILLQALDPVAAARDCLEEVEPAATARGVTVCVEPGPLHAAVLADPTRLRQVLLNLLSNAIKFTSEGGSVRVRVQELPQHIRWDVSDTGAGIPAAHLAEIFEKFVQVDSHRGRAATGTGLGLALTKQLIELMEGTIAVSSAEGVGSTFSVSLPKTSAWAPARLSEVGERR